MLDEGESLVELEGLAPGAAAATGRLGVGLRGFGAGAGARVGVGPDVVGALAALGARVAGLIGAGAGMGVGLGAGGGSSGRRRRRRGSVRRWVCDLRPSGHPDVAQKGVGDLLLERSPAGEEARLMMFCLCLLSLTVWALVSKAMR